MDSRPPWLGAGSSILESKSGTVLVYDTFVDTNGVLLLDHVVDTINIPLAGWNKETFFGAEIQSNKAQGNGGVFNNTINALEAGLTVESNCQNTGMTFYDIALLSRVADITNYFKLKWADLVGTHSLELLENSGAGEVQRALASGIGADPANEALLKLVDNGTSLVGTVGGSMISYSSISKVKATKVGLAGAIAFATAMFNDFKVTKT